MTSRRMKVAWLAAVAVILAMFAFGPGRVGPVVGRAVHPGPRGRQRRRRRHRRRHVLRHRVGRELTDASRSTATARGVEPDGAARRDQRARSATRSIFDTSIGDGHVGCAGLGQGAGPQVDHAHRRPRPTEQFAIYTASDTGNLVQASPRQARCCSTRRSTTSARPPTEAARVEDGAVVGAPPGRRRRSSSASELVSPTSSSWPARTTTPAASDKSAAIGEIASARAAVLGVAYTGSGYNGDQIKSLVNTYGGQVLTNSRGHPVRHPGRQPIGTLRRHPAVRRHLRVGRARRPDRQPAIHRRRPDRRRPPTPRAPPSLGFQNLNPAVQSTTHDGHLVPAGRPRPGPRGAAGAGRHRAGGLRHLPAGHQGQQPQQRAAALLRGLRAPGRARRPRTTAPSPRRR